LFYNPSLMISRLHLLNPQIHPIFAPFLLLELQLNLENMRLNPGPALSLVRIIHFCLIIE
ncbi:MAG: hypothetical protein M0R21_09160, partial [Lentimicrobiaceae bacterium]|nr:hypothetical protein [Lentimicrobiaceae bacterium]